MELVFESAENVPNRPPLTGTGRYTWRLPGQELAQAVEIDFTEELVSLLDRLQGYWTEGDRLAASNWFRRFLPPAILAGLVRAARREGDTTLVIKSNAPELFCLPWELLPVGAQVGDNAGVRFPDIRMRYTPAETVVAAPQTFGAMGEGGRICFAWSDAGGDVAVGAFRELLADMKPNAPAVYAHASADRPWIVEVPKSSAALEDVEVPRATLKVIAEALTQAAEQGDPVRVLHLLCHGVATEDGHGVLALGTRADTQLVSGRALAEALSAADVLSHLRLVVLTVCSGAGGGPCDVLVSPALELHAHGVPAVVAWSRVVAQAETWFFARTFYGHLLGRPREGGGWHPVRDVASAFRETRIAFAAQMPLQVSAAKLYVASQDQRPVFAFLHRPYRGLGHFRVEDARFFIGRERETAAVVRIVNDQRAENEPRLAAVIGDSGAGKSSLLRAGVMASLQGDGHHVDVLVPAGVAARSGELVPLHEFHQQLQELAAAAGERAGPTALLLDQLEPLLDPSHSELWNLVLDVLAQLVAEPGPISVVVALRSHQVQRFASLKLAYGDQTTPTGGHTYLLEGGPDAQPIHSVVVGPPGPAIARDMITKPAARVGLEVPGEIALTALVEQLSNEPSSLPLLQFALDDAWRACNGRTLTMGAAPVSSLREEAERLYEPSTDLRTDAQDSWRKIFRRVLLALVEVKTDPALDGLRACSRDTLIPAESGDHGLAKTIIARLVERRLVVERAGPEQAPWYVLAHYELVRRWPLLKKWVDEQREALVLIRSLEHDATAWRDNEEASDFLRHRGNVLRTTKKALAAHGPLPDGVRVYLDACARADRRRHAVFSVLVAGLAAVALTLSILVGLLTDEKGKTESSNEQLRAEKRRTQQIYGKAVIETATFHLSDNRTDSVLATLAPHIADPERRGHLSNVEQGVIDRVFLLAVAQTADCIADPLAENDEWWRPGRDLPGSRVQARPVELFGTRDLALLDGQDDMIEITEHNVTWRRGDASVTRQLVPDMRTLEAWESYSVARVGDDTLVFAWSDAVVRWTFGHEPEDVLPSKPANKHYSMTSVSDGHEVMVTEEVVVKGERSTKWIAVGAEGATEVCRWDRGTTSDGDPDCPPDIQSWKRSQDGRAWISPAEEPGRFNAIARFEGATKRLPSFGPLHSAAPVGQVEWRAWVVGSTLLMGVREYDSPFAKLDFLGPKPYWRMFSVNGSGELGPAFEASFGMHDIEFLPDGTVIATADARAVGPAVLEYDSSMRVVVRRPSGDVWVSPVRLTRSLGRSGAAYVVAGHVVRASQKSELNEVRKYWLTDDGVQQTGAVYGLYPSELHPERDCDHGWCWVPSMSHSARPSVCLGRLRLRPASVQERCPGIGTDECSTGIIFEAPMPEDVGCASGEAPRGFPWTMGWDPIEAEWMRDLAHHMGSREADRPETVEPILTQLRAAARDDEPSTSRDAARFVLERWGACRSLAQRKEDVHWRDDLYTMFDPEQP